MRLNESFSIDISVLLDVISFIDHIGEISHNLSNKLVRYFYRKLYPRGKLLLGKASLLSRPWHSQYRHTVTMIQPAPSWCQLLFHKNPIRAGESDFILSTWHARLSFLRKKTHRNDLAIKLSWASCCPFVFCVVPKWKTVKQNASDVSANSCLFRSRCCVWRSDEKTIFYLRIHLFFCQCAQQISVQSSPALQCSAPHSAAFTYTVLQHYSALHHFIQIFFTIVCKLQQ